MLRNKISIHSKKSIITGLAVTFDMTSVTGLLNFIFLSDFLIISAAGCINLQWNGALTNKKIKCFDKIEFFYLKKKKLNSLRYRKIQSSRCKMIRL